MSYGKCKYQLLASLDGAVDWNNDKYKYELTIPDANHGAEYVPTLLGHFWAMSIGKYSSTMLRIWDRVHTHCTVKSVHENIA